MKPIALLLDENLSEALLGRLQPLFPGSVHVRRVLRTGATDLEVWEFARKNELILVTRDEDFERLSALHGAPPKVVWLTGHNLGNAQVVALLQGVREAITRLVADETRRYWFWIADRCHSLANSAAGNHAWHGAPGSAVARQSWRFRRSNGWLPTFVGEVTKPNRLRRRNGRGAAGCRRGWCGRRGRR